MLPEGPGRYKTRCFLLRATRCGRAGGGAMVGRPAAAHGRVRRAPAIRHHGRPVATRSARRPRAPPGGAQMEVTTMPGERPGNLGGLVDVDKGIVSREIFVNE